MIWEGFKGYSQLKRQNRIYGLLRRHMTTSEGKDISLIFTYTPKERCLMEEASTYNSWTLPFHTAPYEVVAYTVAFTMRIYRLVFKGSRGNGA